MGLEAIIPPAGPAAEAKPAEPAKPGATPEAKPSEKEASAASRFAKLAKQERGLFLAKQDLVKEREAVKAEREQAAKLRQEIETMKAELEAVRAKAKTNPLGYLEESGVAFEDIQGQVLNDKKPTAELGVKAVRSEVEKLREELKAKEEERQKQTEAEKARAEEQRQAAIAKFHAEVVDFVKGNAAEYKYINALDAHEVVPAVIEEQYRRTQRVMSAKEAAEFVEKHYRERLQSVGQSDGTAKGTALPPQGAEQRTAEPVQRRTLSNGMTASSQAFASAQAGGDRLARALAAMERKQ